MSETLCEISTSCVKECLAVLDISSTKAMPSAWRANDQNSSMQIVRLRTWVVIQVRRWFRISQ